MPTRPQHDRGQVLAGPREEALTPDGAPVSLEALAEDVLEDPAAWFAAPNPRLGGRRPDELIGTDEEHKVYAILNAVDQGLF